MHLRLFFYETDIGDDEIAAALGLLQENIAKEYPVSVSCAGLKTLIVPIGSFETEVSVYPDIDILKQFVIDKNLDIILIWCKEKNHLMPFFISIMIELW